MHHGKKRRRSFHRKNRGELYASVFCLGGDSLRKFNPPRDRLRGVAFLIACVARICERVSRGTRKQLNLIWQERANSICLGAQAPGAPCSFVRIPTTTTTEGNKTTRWILSPPITASMPFNRERVYSINRNGV